MKMKMLASSTSSASSLAAELEQRKSLAARTRTAAALHRSLVAALHRSLVAALHR